jgi:putative SOS response-associated peptidase YedK
LKLFRTVCQSSLDKKDWAIWLGEMDEDARALLLPAGEDVLEVWPIDKKVGNVRTDGPDLIRPVIEAEPLLL